jgi:[calcium/calmodulin-dependent protein kinase] kinase
LAGSSPELIPIAKAEEHKKTRYGTRGSPTGRDGPTAPDLQRVGGESFARRRGSGGRGGGSVSGSPLPRIHIATAGFGSNKLEPGRMSMFGKPGQDSDAPLKSSKWAKYTDEGTHLAGFKLNQAVAGMSSKSLGLSPAAESNLMAKDGVQSSPQALEDLGSPRSVVQLQLPSTEASTRSNSTLSNPSESALDPPSSQPSIATKHTDVITKSSIKMGEMEYCQFNQYVLIKDLGRGVHAKVMLALNTADNVLYAVKVTNNKAAVAETAVRKEIAILKKLKHDNVLKLFEVIDDRNSDELFIVLEYARDGPIFTRHSRLPVNESVLLSYMIDIVQGLDYLHHAVGIAHMDLKPENILKAANGKVKIADFGVSFIIDQNVKNNVRKEGVVGTPAFIAPELLGAAGYDPYIADIWSLGVCLFNMATAQLPFTGKTIFQLIAMATRHGVRFPPLPDLSNDLKNLITIILEVDPKKRATISQIMSHTWITSNGENPLPASLADQPVQIHVTEEEVAAAVRADPLAALLTPVFKPVRFEPGDFVTTKGALEDVMYFINSGECEVLMDALEDDDEQLGGETLTRANSIDGMAVLAVRSAGDIVGEMAVLQVIQKGNSEDFGTRTATVKARTQVDCLSVTAGELLAAIKADKGGRDQLFRTASNRLNQNEEIMLQLAELRSQDAASDGHERKLVPSRTLRVLYAEDSVPTQFIVKRLMKRIGNVELACVNDGKAALEYCEKCARGEMVCPDIILMDCQMPVMDGLKATTSIRALPHTTVSSIPIVAVSSGVKSMSQKDCIDAGMDDYAAKPLNQKILIDVLVRNLNADLSQPVDAVDVVPVLWT